MSRRKIKKINNILPDIKYNSKLVSKFINILMLNGKKSLAQNILYSALYKLKNINNNEIEIFNKAIDNVKPLLEIKSRRVGGSTYQIPIEIKEDRSYTLAIRWIIRFARKRKIDKTMNIKLSNELNDAFLNKGSSIKKRDEIYKIAESNKAFAHYKW
ncbi:30S ribosomal protein S7 [endosymbiont of Sipalinus gigas]|uniref:30S ribosomal protein S7 n=1 Tax=endosymbiont of Sipalinus gigas TaxID=1972134 RepID=UPI000DC6D622|nr:30S ribosomal protein S7 [endosymbiont of Sipalinus gigas]BBA85268.1 30S ribosomal protein S7 [endosymbiont of Sipalinus gigas]